MTQTASHYQNLFFSTGVIPTKSDALASDYYKDVTHGLIDIQGQVVGPFRLPQTLARRMLTAFRAWVPPTPMPPPWRVMPPRRPTPPSTLLPMTMTAMASWTPSSLSLRRLWAQKLPAAPATSGLTSGRSMGGALSMDGTKIFGYLTVPEDAKIGVCCHELGHLLFGFPDLYDTDGSSEGIGNFCLMAAGSWGGGGDTPVHPSAWCKANQGWATVDNRTTNGSLSITDVKSSQTIYRLWKNGAAGSEYFLVENRQKTGFDVSLPGGGLLIWHIDESVTGNTNEALQGGGSCRRMVKRTLSTTSTAVTRAIRIPVPPTMRRSRRAPRRTPIRTPTSQPVSP